MPEARQAIPGDLPFLKAVTAAAYAEYAPLLDAPPLPVTEDYEPYIAEGGVFIVSRDGADVGALTTQTHPDHIMIFSLALAPEQQGHGLGRWMLGFAENLARQAGLPEVRLYTNGKMTRNIAIYGRAGYHETGRQENPRRPGWIAVHMAKRV